jgi:hypothetical protein
MEKVIGRRSKRREAGQTQADAQEQFRPWLARQQRVAKEDALRAGAASAKPEVYERWKCGA